MVRAISIGMLVAQTLVTVVRHITFENFPASFDEILTACKKAGVTVGGAYDPKEVRARQNRLGKDARKRTARDSQYRYHRYNAFPVC